jgi:2-polyprenyl-3-methyl-5-hydroxy-6-metoxy-1,4-benzoquinol methylase
MPTPEALIELYDADYYGNAETESTIAQDGDRQSEVRSVGQRRPAGTQCANANPTEGYAAYAEQREARILSFRRYAKAISARQPGARVLDVGCALGFFLEAALEQDLDAHGIDASEAAIASILPKYGSRVRSGTLESLIPTAQASFDVVFASDLIEHVPTPLSFVEQVSTLLKPGGEFWGVTPNAKSLLARVSRRQWVSFKPPEHVILYTPKHLRRLLAPHFKSIRITPALQEYSASLVADRLSQLLGPAGSFAKRAGQSLGSRSLRIFDGNMCVRARRR